MKTIKVSESNFEPYEYSLRVKCPYCKKNIFFFEYQKWINKVDVCPNCGKQFQAISDEEVRSDDLKQKYNEWLKENGGEKGALYRTFPDEELWHIFSTAYEQKK